MAKPLTLAEQEARYQEALDIIEYDGREIARLKAETKALRAENERLRKLWVAFERYSGVCVGAFLRFGCGSGFHSPKCVGLDTKSAALAQHEPEGGG